MARFRNSNKHAATQLTVIAARKIHKSPMPEIEQSYFRRIGFDFAMI